MNNKCQLFDLEQFRRKPAISLKSEANEVYKYRIEMFLDHKTGAELCFELGDPDQEKTSGGDNISHTTIKLSPSDVMKLARFFKMQ